MNDTTVSPPPRPRAKLVGRFTRGILRTLQVVLLFAVLVAVALWGYCRWMENFVEEQLHSFWSEDIFDVDRVDFSPWSHEITLYDLSWSNPPGYKRSRKAIEIRKVRADLELDRLREGILHFRRIEIGDMELNLEFGTRSIAQLALLMDDPEPAVNLYEAIQFQYNDEPGETNAVAEFLKWVRIDTLAVGETQLRFGNISDIPGLNIVLNLNDCFSLRLAPYNRFGIGFERPLSSEEALEEIIDHHIREVRSLLVDKLSFSSSTLTQLYHETFSAQLRECERRFQNIREWSDLLDAAQEMFKLDDQPGLQKAMKEFLKKYPYTLATVKRLHDDFRAYKAGVISQEELKARQELVRKSRHAEQALHEWQHRWWNIWE